jgi:GNAT superfamily N-acetyltransferase
MEIFNRSLVKFQIIEMDEILTSPSLLATARSLTLGRSSGMNSALDYYSLLVKERSVDALGIFANYMGSSIGWALFSYEKDHWGFEPQPGQVCAQVYVSVGYRRCGVGRDLIRMISKMAKPDIVRVYAWSNYAFFEPLMKEMPHFQEL